MGAPMIPRHVQACLEAGATELELAARSLVAYVNHGTRYTRRWRIVGSRAGNSRLVSRREYAERLQRRWGGNVSVVPTARQAARLLIDSLARAAGGPT